MEEQFAEYGAALARLRQDDSRRVSRPWQEVMVDVRTVILEMAKNSHLHVVDERDFEKEPRKPTLEEMEAGK